MNDRPKHLSDREKEGLESLLCLTRGRGCRLLHVARQTNNKQQVSAVVSQDIH